ncbi:MAG: lipocalin family protein, partial [Myxococcota bacterium]|nr:lipocalin family protein [Myxococcota bacterium]
MSKGHVPYPDRMFEGPVEVALDRLQLDFDGQRFERMADGRYALSLYHDHFDIGVELCFEPRKAAVRHGDDGVVQSVHGESMFYYFIPRCDVSGELRFGGKEGTPRVVERCQRASGWYDHEFGRHVSTQGQPSEVGGSTANEVDIGWNWISTQLDDGTDVTAYALTDRKTGESAGRWAVVIAADGSTRTFTRMRFEQEGLWRSTRTFNDYPTRWRLEVPEAGLDLTARPAFDDQEFITLISKPAFWEGRLEVEGTLANRPVQGPGYAERSGFVAAEDLESFFSQVGLEVRATVEAIIPFDPSFEQARDLVASEARTHYMDGVDIDTLVDTMVR